ncbi:MAG: SCP2 domain-containing protein, partial [Gammaproteobacteria bacterium]
MIADLLAPQRVLDRIADLINRWLKSDDAASARLLELAGRSVEVRLARLNLKLVLAVEADGILLATRSAGAADVVLEGTLSDLLAMARAQRTGTPVPAGKVRIQGDLATVRQFETAFDELSFDWEAELARVVGDIPARQIARALAGASGFMRQAHRSLERDMGNYLLEETRALAAAEEIAQLGA